MGRTVQKVNADDVVPVAEARSSLFFLASSVELPDVLTFVFSWQRYQLCVRTKYRGTEHRSLVHKSVSRICHPHSYAHKPRKTVAPTVLMLEIQI